MRSDQNSVRALARLLVVLPLLVGFELGRPKTAAGQAEFPGAPDEQSATLRLYPLDTWSPRVGVGIGAGVVVHHLGGHNAQALLTVAPARHEQVAALAWASANPDRARRYVVVTARGLHTNRDWFYGLGPRSSEANRQSIERSALRVGLRAGRHVLDRRLLVETHLGLSAHRVDRVPSPAAPALAPRSRQHLRQLASARIGPLRPSQTGLRIGVGLQYDTRSPAVRPTQGVLLTADWTRFVAVSSSLLNYDRWDVEAYGYLPLAGGHHLVTRLSLAHTVSRGRAAVPYYLRPTLGGTLVPGWARHRFVDSDRLIGSVLYRFPIARPLNVLRLDGHLGVHAASVYENVFSEFALALNAETTLDAGPGAVPLRPAASLGLHVGLSFRQTPSLDLALGVSPEGVTAVRFTLNQPLWDFRPAHHRIRR